MSLIIKYLKTKPSIIMINSNNRCQNILIFLLYVIYIQQAARRRRKKNIRLIIPSLSSLKVKTNTLTIAKFIRLMYI